MDAFRFPPRGQWMDYKCMVRLSNLSTASGSSDPRELYSRAIVRPSGLLYFLPAVLIYSLFFACLPPAS